MKDMLRSGHNLKICWTVVCGFFVFGVDYLPVHKAACTANAFYRAHVGEL